jgi:hypothetical protein
MQASLAQGGVVFLVLFSLYVNDMSLPSRHVVLALYKEYTDITVSYLSDQQRWLREWRITINVSNSTALLFAKAGRRIPKPRPVKLYGEPVNSQPVLWRVPLDARLIWLRHIDQVGKNAAQNWEYWVIS